MIYLVKNLEMKEANTGLVIRAIRLYPDLALSLSTKFGPQTSSNTGLLSCDPRRADCQLRQILEQNETEVRKWSGLI